MPLALLRPAAKQSGVGEASWRRRISYCSATTIDTPHVPRAMNWLLCRWRRCRCYSDAGGISPLHHHPTHPCRSSPLTHLLLHPPHVHLLRCVYSAPENAAGRFLAAGGFPHLLCAGGSRCGRGGGRQSNLSHPAACSACVCSPAGWCGWECCAGKRRWCCPCGQGDISSDGGGGSSHRVTSFSRGDLSCGQGDDAGAE